MTARQGLPGSKAAARCYLRGGDQDGACHCFERLGAWAEAAGLHESAGRMREAASAVRGRRAPPRTRPAATAPRAISPDEARRLLRGGEGAPRGVGARPRSRAWTREAREIAGIYPPVDPPRRL